MKQLFSAILVLGFSATVLAQQKEGKVIYKRSTQFSFSVNNGGGDAPPIQQTQSVQFELNFANGQMVWQQLPEDIQENASSSAGGGGNGGIVIRTMGGGDDLVFCDFAEAKKVESRELFDKKFIITDSIRRGTWKLTDETKTILGLACRKATSQRIGKRMMMQMENGKMERKEVADTSTIIAWFTMAIPVPAGPEMQGQLPGLILEMETNGGRTVYTALEISDKPDLNAIKPPSKGKKVTTEQFNKERDKMFEEMQRNNNGKIRFRAG